MTMGKYELNIITGFLALLYSSKQLLLRRLYLYESPNGHRRPKLVQNLNNLENDESD